MLKQSEERNPIVLRTNQDSMIHFPEVIKFEKSANKSIKIDITNSTGNNLQLKKHSQLDDVM